MSSNSRAAALALAATLSLPVAAMAQSMVTQINPDALRYQRTSDQDFVSRRVTAGNFPQNRNDAFQGGGRALSAQPAGGPGSNLAASRQAPQK